MVSISAPANGSTTGDNTPTLTYSVTETNLGTTTCSLDGGAFVACSSPLSTLADGAHSIAVRHVDLAGNSTTTTNTFTVDTTGPAAPTINTGPSGVVGSNSATFTFTGAEGGGTYECRIDGGSWGACTSGVNYPGLTDGSHTFEVRQIDGVGNAGTIASRTWTVDTTSPTVDVTSPIEGSLINDNTPSAVFAVTDANVGTTECATDGGAFSACTSPYTTSTLTDGSHSISVRHTDQANNVTTVVRNFTVDTTPPVVTVSAPADGSVTNDSTPTLTYNVTDTNLGTTTCSLDGGAFGACVDPLPSLADGAHTIAVRHVDLAGNSTTVTNSFTVDTAAPAAPVITSPADGTLTSDNTPTISGTAEANSVVEVFADAVSLGTAVTDGSGNWTFTPGTPIADGTYDFTATATDSGGNTSAASAAVEITIDSTAPTAPVITSPSNGTLTSDNTPTVTGTAEANSTVEVFADGVSLGTATADGAGDWTFTPGSAIADGTYDFTATATDAAGNESVPSTPVEITIDTTAPAAPAITSPSDGTITNDNTPTVSGTAEANSTVEVFADGISVGTTTADGAGNWTFTPGSAIADGTYDFTATATDAAGNESVPSAPVEITIDTTAPAAPVITSPADGTVTNDTTPTISGIAEPASTVEVFADGVSLGTTIADGSGNWTFTPGSALAEDTYTFTAFATDAAGNESVESAGVDVTIDTTAPSAPTIDSPSDGAVMGDSTPQIGGTAEANSTVEVFADGISLGTTTTDGSGNWVFIPGAPLADGTYELTAFATDEAGNTSLVSNAVDLTIDTIAPAAPVIVVSGRRVFHQRHDADDHRYGRGEQHGDVYVDGFLVGTTTADGSGDWSLDSSPLIPGDRVITATSTDEAGNESAAVHAGDDHDRHRRTRSSRSARRPTAPSSATARRRSSSPRPTTAR